MSARTASCRRKAATRRRLGPKASTVKTSRKAKGFTK